MFKFFIKICDRCKKIEITKGKFHKSQLITEKRNFVNLNHFSKEKISLLFLLLNTLYSVLIVQLNTLYSIVLERYNKDNN